MAIGSGSYLEARVFTFFEHKFGFIVPDRILLRIGSELKSFVRIPTPELWDVSHDSNGFVELSVDDYFENDLAVRGHLVLYNQIYFRKTP